MSIVTKEEKKWLKKLEKLLMNPPSDRIGFYTIGDNDIMAYDMLKEHLFDEDNYFCSEVEKHDAELGHIPMTMPMHSTVG